MLARLHMGCYWIPWLLLVLSLFWPMIGRCDDSARQRGMSLRELHRSVTDLLSPKQHRLVPQRDAAVKTVLPSHLVGPRKPWWERTHAALERVSERGIPLIRDRPMRFMMILDDPGGGFEPPRDRDAELALTIGDSALSLSIRRAW